MEFINALPTAISQGLIWGIMAIGFYISYKVLDFSDLTVDGSFCTGGAVCAVLIVSGVNPGLALLVAMLAGMAAGLLTGLLHAGMGIPPILSGILTQLMLYSINLKIMGGANLTVSARTFAVWVSSANATIAIPIILAFVVVIVFVLYWFFGTEVGCSIRATGNNPNMSRAQGINTNFYKVLGLVISNGIVALAGGLLAQYQGFADINMGRGAIVIGLAAIIVGTAVVKKISRNFAIKMGGVALGGVIYYIVLQAVIAMGLDTDLLKMLSAVVVAIFLGVPHLRKKLMEGKHIGKKKGKAVAAEPEEIAPESVVVEDVVLEEEPNQEEVHDA